MEEMRTAAGVLSEEEALMLLLLLLLPPLETTSTFFFSLQHPPRKAATGYVAAGCFMKTGEAVRPVARSAGMPAAATAPAKSRDKMPIAAAVASQKTSKPSTCSRNTRFLRESFFLTLMHLRVERAKV
jgi:hypothetical protein